MFIKYSDIREATIFLVYVNNIIVTEDDEKNKLMFKQCLVRKFKIKELVKLKYFQRIEVIRSK